MPTAMVEYLMERAVDGLNPYQEYSFAEILKEGGICGDQSYFCVNTARAQGIPAMTIAGETDLGGHAWAGLKFDIRRVDHRRRPHRRRLQRRRRRTRKPAGRSPNRKSSFGMTAITRVPLVTLAVCRHLWLADFFAATGE